MVKKKGATNADRQVNKPTKPKFVFLANQYYSKTVAQLEKKYRLAMRMKNYEEANRIYKEIIEARKKHRNLIHRREYEKLK